MQRMLLQFVFFATSPYSFPFQHLRVVKCRSPASANQNPLSDPPILAHRPAVDKASLLATGRGIVPPTRMSPVTQVMCGSCPTSWGEHRRRSMQLGSVLSWMSGSWTCPSVPGSCLSLAEARPHPGVGCSDFAAWLLVHWHPPVFCERGGLVR